MHTLLLIVLIGLSYWLVTAGVLFVSSKWVRLPRPRFRRVVGFVALFALSTALLMLSAELTFELDWGRPLTLGLPLGMALVLSWFLLRRLYRTTYRRALRGFVCGTLAVGSSVGLHFGIVRPYLVQSMGIDGSSMSPTIRDRHCFLDCPHCGGSLIYMPKSDWKRTRHVDGRDIHQVHGMCADCLKDGWVEEREARFRSRDHVLCNRTLLPRRWDAVIFDSPAGWLESARHWNMKHRAGQRWGKRIVGLPGERVIIAEDGSVWINDQRLDPPTAIPRIAYSQRLVNTTAHEYVCWGTPGRPAELGPDQYYVLGDNTFESGDSRLHGPVARADIVGVIEIVCWPPTRWKLLPRVE